MTHASALVAVALALTTPKPDSGLQVSVEIDPCLDVARSEVLRVTALELDAQVVPPERARPAATRVSVSCADKYVRLRVTDPVTGKTLERTLALNTDEVDVTGRAVALAVAELVLTSWMELTMPEPPPAAVGYEPTPPEVQDAAEERALELGGQGVRVNRVLALGQVSGPFEGIGYGVGGGVRVNWSFGPRWLGGDLDFVVTQADADAPLGSVRASTWSSALRASIDLWLDPAWLEVGAGGRFGIARLVGTPRDEQAVRGGVVAGVWTGPVAYAGGGLQVWHVAFSVGLEAGYTLHGVSGLIDEGNPMSVDGGWLAASAGLGWAR